MKVGKQILTLIGIYVLRRYIVKTFMFIGPLFIIIGAVFLLKNLGIISYGAWNLIWPLTFVVFGLYLLWKKHRFNVE